MPGEHHVKVKAEIKVILCTPRMPEIDSKGPKARGEEQPHKEPILLTPTFGV